MKNCDGKHSPDRIGTFAPYNTDTSSIPVGQTGRSRWGRWLCAQRTGDKIPETIRGQRRGDTGGGAEADGEAGPGAQRRESKGAEARQTRMGPKPQKEYGGGEACGEDDGDDTNPWRLCIEKKGKFGEQQKEFLY
jgi:hypothetical protein